LRQVFRADDRFVTRTDWLTSWHSFSYGQWYDPANVGFGPLVVSNHDVLAPGAGFDEHVHSGVDVVTYVVSGLLEHRDSIGHQAVVGAGEVQVLRSGSGVTHSERNASATKPVEYVQMWLRSEATEPSYTGSSGGPVRLASGDLDVVDVLSEQPLTLAAAPMVHVYVLSGSAWAADVEVSAGDAVRLTDEALTVAGSARLLVWRLQPQTR
jgi:quercetin 2,3-dioxygenase